MVVKPIVHEIRIQNQVIFLDPPIEYARQTWIHQLHDWLGVCSLSVWVIWPPLTFWYARYCVPFTQDTELSVRDWTADAE